MRHVIIANLPDEGLVQLPEAESHHLLRVLRLNRGDRLSLSNGRGKRAQAELMDVRQGIACLRLESVCELPSPIARIVILGMPKGPLLEEALTLGTEAGATEFRLVQAQFSQPFSLKMDRLLRLIEAAAIQCHRDWLPTLSGPLPLAKACQDLPASRYVCTQGAPPLTAQTAATALAIGPEGGWSASEQAHLQTMGFAPAALGPHTLRAPTAVAVGLGRLYTEG